MTSSVSLYQKEHWKYCILLASAPKAVYALMGGATFNNLPQYEYSIPWGMHKGVLWVTWVPEHKEVVGVNLHQMGVEYTTIEAHWDLRWYEYSQGYRGYFEERAEILIDPSKPLPPGEVDRLPRRMCLI